MDWRNLGKAVSLYNQTGNTYPKEPLNPYERWYTETIRNPTPQAIKDFLTKWGKMRMPFNTSSIQTSINSTSNVLTALKPIDFELAPLNQIRNSIMDSFQGILKGVKSKVAASKTLHALAPKLFIMWDNTIIAAYGCSKLTGTWSEIYFVFMVRVQRRLREALESYSKTHNLKGIKEAADTLRQELYAKGQKPLSKIVDEYNFMKYTKGKNELWV